MWETRARAHHDGTTCRKNEDYSDKQEAHPCLIKVHPINFSSKGTRRYIVARSNSKAGK